MVEFTGEPTKRDLASVGRSFIKSPEPQSSFLTHILSREKNDNFATKVPP